MAACVMWKKPARLTAVIARESSAVYSRERLADEDPGDIDQAVDPPESVQRAIDDSPGGAPLPRCPPGRSRSRIRRTEPIERELPTTAYPAPRNAATRPAPMPCEAPVTIATFGWSPPSDEVRLVYDAAGLAAADADEDALVQPVELGAAVSIWVEVRNVYSLASTSSPCARRARTSGCRGGRRVTGVEESPRSVRSV